MLQLPIFLDNNATTRMDDQVLSAMLPYFCEQYGNASSTSHRFGRDALKAVEEAREQVALMIGAHIDEIVFTSGATESNNISLKGVLTASENKSNHIITSTVEHHSVLEICREFERLGAAKISYIPVDQYGQVSPLEIENEITDNTVLISIMYANNEVGTVQPVKEIGHIAKTHGVPFHCDAAQAVGKVPIDIEADGIDLLSFSAHKMYGPKGCGALFLRKKTPYINISPIFNGHHENGLRAGSLNVSGIVGLGKAAEIVHSEMPTEQNRIAKLRTRLLDGINNQLKSVFMNGHPYQRLPGNLHLSFSNTEGEAILMELEDDVALSTGSACSSERQTPSHVLTAMGIEEDLILSSVRFGIGRYNTKQEIDYVIERVVSAINFLRDISVN